MKSAVIEIRVDIRDLATVLAYLVKKGIRPTSKCSLGSYAVEMAAELVRSFPDSEDITTAERALELLQMYNIGNVNRGGRGINALREQIRVDMELTRKTSDVGLEA